MCGNGTQLTLGLVLEGGQPTQGSVREPDVAGTAAQHSGQSFFKAGGDDNCFHTALLEEFSPKFGDISDRKPALDPRFVLLGRILQFPSKPPSSPMVGPMPDER